MSENQRDGQQLASRILFLLDCVAEIIWCWRQE
jgi:hypothetical protein